MFSTSNRKRVSSVKCVTKKSATKNSAKVRWMKWGLSSTYCTIPILEISSCASTSDSSSFKTVSFSSGNTISNANFWWFFVIIMSCIIVPVCCSSAISPLDLKIFILSLISFLYKSTRHSKSGSDFSDKQKVLTSSSKASASIRVCNGMPVNSFSLSLIDCASFSINALA